MSWLFFAFSGPVWWQCPSTSINLVERDFKNTGVRPVRWVLRPVVAIDLADAGAVTASGVLHVGALYLYLQGLKVEDASVVTRFFQAALFGHVLSYRVLGERLTFGQDFGGLLLIGGAAVGARRQTRARVEVAISHVDACALSMPVAKSLPSPTNLMHKALSSSLSPSE